MNKIVGALLFLLLLALPLAAQTSSIRGRVTTPEGDALPGVTVTAEDLGVSAITDGEGNYVLAIPASARSQVRVTASLSGFQTRTETVDASRGDATQNITLRVSFGEQIT
ncbi:MAG TPA: carboxypeptidase regulatory-like domain-containing protein, partial [Thermoanaerobaculia bacterium]